MIPLTAIFSLLLSVGITGCGDAEDDTGEDVVEDTADISAE